MKIKYPKQLDHEPTLADLPWQMRRNIREQDGHWIWHGWYAGGTGYPAFNVRGVTYYARRYIASLVYGRLSKDMRARCDCGRDCVHPRCVKIAFASSWLLESDSPVTALCRRTECHKCGRPLTLVGKRRTCEPCGEKKRMEWRLKNELNDEARARRRERYRLKIQNETDADRERRRMRHRDAMRRRRARLREGALSHA